MSDLWSRKYQEYRHRCAYCGKHLFTDFDTFMGSTLDHIVPKRAEPPLSEAEFESEDNRALACATCNVLKGGWDPREGDMSRSKEQLIDRAREIIFQRRSKKVKQFLNYLEHPEKVSSRDAANREIT